MSTSYPTSQQTFTDPIASNPLNSPSHSTLHTNMNDTVEALQAQLGYTGAFLFAKLAGQSGGQTLSGGTAASENLTLQSTAHATKGFLIFDDFIKIWPSQGTFTTSQSLVKYDPTFSMTSTGGVTTRAHNFIDYMPTVTLNFDSSTVVTQALIAANPTVTFQAGLAYIYSGFSHAGTFTSTANPAFANTFFLFYGAPTMSSSTASVSPIAINGIFASNATLAAGNVNVGSTFLVGYSHTGHFNATGASSAMTISQDTGMSMGGDYNAFTAGGALTITVRRMARWINFSNQTGGLTGTVTITSNVGIDLEDQSASSGNLTVSNMYGIRSVLTSGTNRWFIYHSGTADSSIKGNLRLGDNTAPTTLLDIIGKLTINSSGLVTKYNNIATVSGGIPSELATVDLATKSAAISATTIYTPTASGMFRISATLQVTRAATSSSTLGGASGLVITFNDGDGNIAQSNTMAMRTTAGAVAINSTGNTTATNLHGEMIVYARTGVAIQYAIGYTSSGVTSMQYSAHLKVEAL